MKKVILLLALSTPLLAQKRVFRQSRNSVATVNSAPYVFPVAIPNLSEPEAIPPLRAKGVPFSEGQVIQSIAMELAFNKTTCIIFKSPIRSVDLGSHDIMADKASEVENVLRIKATRIGFNETNFSVITADGKFYSFLANYNESPPVLALNLAADQAPVEPASRQLPLEGQGQPLVEFAGVRTTQQEIVERCAAVLRQPRRVRRVGRQEYGINATLRGLYIKDNVLYYKIALHNKSNIKYDLDFIRFFIADKKLARQTSRQELEVTPLYVYNEPLAVVGGKQTVEKVFAFPKFTIPNGKVLKISVGERNGGRAVAFNVSNRDILNADTL